MRQKNIVKKKYVVPIILSVIAITIISVTRTTNSGILIAVNTILAFIMCVIITMVLTIAIRRNFSKFARCFLFVYV